MCTCTITGRCCRYVARRRRALVKRLNKSQEEMGTEEEIERCAGTGACIALGQKSPAMTQGSVGEDAWGTCSCFVDVGVVSNRDIAPRKRAAERFQEDASRLTSTSRILVRRQKYTSVWIVCRHQLSSARDEIREPREDACVWRVFGMCT